MQRRRCMSLNIRLETRGRERSRLAEVAPLSPPTPSVSGAPIPNRLAKEFLRSAEQGCCHLTGPSGYSVSTAWSRSKKVMRNDINVVSSPSLGFGHQPQARELCLGEAMVRIDCLSSAVILEQISLVLPREHHKTNSKCLIIHAQTC